MPKTKSIGVSLPEMMIASLDELAIARSVSRSDLIRQSIELAVPFLTIKSKIDVWRVVANIEYLSLFVDAMLTRDHPDLAQSLPSETLQRMEKFHA